MHVPDPAPWTGDGPFWGKLERDANAAGTGFGMLHGSVLINAGCGRADLLSSIIFAHHHGVKEYVLTDVDLPMAKKSMILQP